MTILPPVRAQKSAILLVNLGSPAEPTTAAVRAYLREFLGDPAVVRLPRWLWLPLLHGVILPLRAPRSAALYKKVWSPAGSPLLVFTRAQAAALAERLGAAAVVTWAMRYGEPSLASALDEILAAGCDELLLLPLFPQWSATTSGTIESAVRAELARRGERIALRILPSFAEEAGYVAALAACVRATAGALAAEHLLFSFHGLPARYVAAGDPYRDQCEATAAALARALGLSRERWTLAYQSRFGPERWLEPYALDVVPKLARRHARVAVVCPGFVSDCLETLEEVHLQLGERFRAAGGQEWTVVPCLNAHPAWITALEQRVRRELTTGPSAAPPR